MKKPAQIRVAACIGAIALACGLGLANTDAEDALKSAAVWGFLRYSDWPATGAKSITVGVLGRSSFVQVLRQTLDGKTVQNLPVRVVEFKSDPHCCQLIYFATGHAEEIRQVLQSAPPHVLTVGEDDRFLDYGGAVNLFIDDGHIAFETSLDALSHSGVTISASLLRLGQIRERGRKKGSR